MIFPLRAWKEVLDTLGLGARSTVTGRAKAKKPTSRGRVMRIESLEDRHMLSGTTLWFVGAVNGTWDTTTANWSDGTNTVDWQNGDTAVFDGTVPNVTIAPGVAISAAEIDLTGGCTIAAGTGGSLEVCGSGVIDVAAGITDTISAPLVGSNGLTLTDSGTLALGAANTYSGATLVESGVLQLQNASALGSSSSVSALSAGTLDLDGQAIGSAVPLDDFAGAITNSDTGVAASFSATINATTHDSFTVSGSGDITLGGAIYGSSTVTLTKSGTNTLTIGNAAGFNGLSESIEEGDVVTQSGGVFTSLAIGPGSTMTIAPSGPVVTITTLYWDPGQTGPTTGAASGGDGTWDTASYDWYNPATGTDQAWNPSNTIAAFSGTSGTVTLDTSISANELSFQSGDYTLTGGSLSAAEDGGFKVAAGLTATIDSAIDGDGGISKSGTGDLVLGGANTYTGQTSAIGGTLTLANPDALGDSSGLTCNMASTLDLDGQAFDSSVPIILLAGVLTNSSSAAASFAGSINVGTIVGFPFTVSGTGNITLSGDVAGYSYGTLTKIGDNTLTLSGTAKNQGLAVIVDSGTLVLAKASSSRVQAIQGGLTIEGGTVQFAGTGTEQIESDATIEIDSGTLDLNGENETVGTPTGAGGTVTNTLADSTATLTIGADDGGDDGAGTFAGAIQDDGTGIVAIVKTGAGTQILTGASDYSGGTTIDTGTLQLGDGFSSNGSITGDVADDGSLIFAEIYSQTYAGSISGTGGVAQDGYNTLTLTGANSYTGATDVNSGALILGPGGSLGDTAISVADGAAFDPQPGSGTLSAGGTGSGSAGATLTLASGSTFDMTDGATGTFDLQQESGLSGTALSIDGATLNFDLSSSAADELVASGAASVSGANTINITGLSAGMTTEQSFTLISAASGLSGTFEFANGTTTESLFQDNQTYTLQLSNSGTAETLTVSALPDYAVFINGAFCDGSTTVNLGTAYANEPTIATVVVENTGSGTLTLSDPISLPTGFTLAADYGTLVLAAGQSTSFAIRLDSPVEGSFSGTLSIATDDPVQPTFDVTISGQVVARVAGVNDPNFDSSGDGWTTVDNSGAVGGQELTAPGGTGENIASWVFNDLDPNTEYEVLATWTAASGQATNATYTILDGSNSEGPADAGDGDTPAAPYVVGTLATVSVDQTAAPSDETVGGIAWSSIGSFTATSGVMEIDLSDNANGTVVAGGIRIVAVHQTEPPVLEAITNQTTTAGDDLSIQLGANDPDAPSGDLTYSLLNNTPPGLSIDSSTGLITWDTTGVPAGTYGITAQVTDSAAPTQTDAKQFSITVDNTATPTGSGEDTVIVYSSSDANEGGTPGNIRLLRTGDQTGALTVQFQIDETVTNAAQYGSGLEYVGPDISTTVDGILYGYATFDAGDNTTDISIDASADTDNAVNPTVSFKLLPQDFTIPGDADPAYIVSNNYNVGSPSAAAPVIRSSLHLEGATAFVGLEELAVDHNTILDAEAIDPHPPAGATVTYTITGGNGIGVFTLTQSGTLMLAEDAAVAGPGTYNVVVAGTGIFADGTKTNTSTATETITIGPSIGMYGDTMAVRGTNDVIDLTFARFGGNINVDLPVQFAVEWGTAEATDFSNTQGDLAKLLAGEIVIPAGVPSVTMVLYAVARTGQPLAPAKLRITLEASSDGVVSYFPDKIGDTHLGDSKANAVVWQEDLYVLDAVTAFATANTTNKLADPPATNDNPGINVNDVIQGGLGDCYFMAAEMALAQSNPQAIASDITQNSDGSFTVRLYNDPSKSWPGGKDVYGNEINGWVNFTISINLLSNGWSMAQLSGDYVDSPTAPNNGAVEIWPQLLEDAWVQLVGGGSYQAIVSGSPANALTALTGQKFTPTSLERMSNHEISTLILDQYYVGVITGRPVVVGTYNDASGKKGAFSLGPGNGSVYYNHAYVVEGIKTDADGNFIGIVLLNPWGAPSGKSPDYEITVPIADFSVLFASLYFSPLMP